MSVRSNKKESGSDRQEPSKVLLVCVYDTLIIDITNEMIYEKFKRFGSIIKLLIFEKGEVTKFFIEYSDLEQAVKVHISSHRRSGSSRGPSFSKPFAK